MVRIGGAEALRNAVGGVSALIRKQRRPPQVPQRATVSEAHGQGCRARDMMYDVGPEASAHRTRRAVQRDITLTAAPLTEGEGGGGGR